MRNLQKRRHQAEAQAFIESEELEVICDYLRWDVSVIRQAMVVFHLLSKNWGMVTELGNAISFVYYFSNQGDDCFGDGGI